MKSITVCCVVVAAWALAALSLRAAPVAEMGAVVVKAGPLVEPFRRTGELRIGLLVENRGDREVELRLAATAVRCADEKERVAYPERTVSLGPKFSGEKTVTVPAGALKEWSAQTPELYRLELEITGAGQTARAQARFGYRQLWVEEGRFLLNGKAVFLRGGNHNGRRTPEEMRLAKWANINADTVRGGYAAIVGTLDLADTAGHYNVWWVAPDKREFLYQSAATKDKREFLAGNHPSVVAYSYYGPVFMPAPAGHPMQIGWVITPEQYEKEEACVHARAIQALDPTRIGCYYQRGLGAQFRSLMWDLSWGTHAQEMEEWLSYWAGNRGKVEPFFAQEFALMRMGSHMVNYDRHFGRACLVEQFARYIGDEAYRLAGEPDTIKSCRPGVRYPDNEVRTDLFFRQKEHIYGRVMPAWRTWGNGHMLLHVDGHTNILPPRPIDKERQRQTSPMADICRRLFAERFFWLAGPEEDFVSKDHAFRPGEAVSKSAVFINDSPSDARVAVAFTVTDAAGRQVAEGGGPLEVRQGRVGFFPVRFPAPHAAQRSAFVLRATCVDEAGARYTADREFEFQVHPPAPNAAPVEAWLIDDTGDTARALDGLARLKRLAAPEELDAVRAGLLIVGRNSYLTAAKWFRERDILPAIEGGLNVVVLAQRNRHVMGLQTENFNLREAFIRRADSPLTAGLADADLRDWRGRSAMLPDYPSFDTESLWYTAGYSYQGQMNRFRQRRAWHWTNKAMVNTFTFEKPQFGNYRILLDGGFDLLYTPLVEFQAGKGRILLCQLDLVERCGMDPVAALLVRRILAEYSRTEARALTPVGAVSPAAAAALGELRMATAKGLTGGVAFLLPADLEAIRPEELRAYLDQGGNVVTTLATAEQAARLPVKVELAARELFNPALPADPAFAGLGMSDLYLREVQKGPFIAAVAGAPAVVSPDGVAAAVSVGKGKLVILQIAHDRYVGAEGFWERSKVIRLWVTVLSNLGGLSTVRPDPTGVSSFGLPEEWLAGYAERVPKKGFPRLAESPLYQQPALDWDPESHVAF